MISQSHIDEFQRNGAICLRGVFDQKWLDLLGSGIEKNRKDPGPFSCQYTPKNQQGDFYDDYCNWDKIDEYKDFKTPKIKSCFEPICVAMKPIQKTFMNNELKNKKKQIKVLENDLLKLLIPKDKNDKKNSILEIRAGTGGDEASLFAADLFSMYQKYADLNSWKIEVLSI